MNVYFPREDLELMLQVLEDTDWGEGRERKRFEDLNERLIDYLKAVDIPE